MEYHQNLDTALIANEVVVSIIRSEERGLPVRYILRKLMMMSPVFCVTLVEEDSF